MKYNDAKCSKCGGRNYFHIGDRVSFGGGFSHFSLRDLSTAALIAGLRVQNARDAIVALVTEADSKTSSTVRSALARKIPVLEPDDFRQKLKNVCDGNVPVMKNPNFSSTIEPGGRYFAIGLDNSDLKLLNAFLKRNSLIKAQYRVASVKAAISSPEGIRSGDALVLKSMGVPVYNINKIRSYLET
jgi:hypothetical protein